MKLTSSAFQYGTSIPERYTGEGEDISPPLQWYEVPERCEELLLLCEDPDAPSVEPFVHWIAYGIPPSESHLPDGMPAKASTRSPVHLHQGRNSFGGIGYRGPMPPQGDGPHRYFFRLFALDRASGLSPGARKSEVVRAIEGHIMAQGELMGTYEREAAQKSA